MPSTLVSQAEALARQLLEQDPGGLRRAEWTAQAAGMVLERAHLEVDHDLVIAAAWASATIGARTWEDRGSEGYQVEDVVRDLGPRVARVVASLVREPWEDEDEHLRGLLGHRSVEAKTVAMAQVLVEVALAGRDVDEGLAVRLARASLEVCPDLVANAAVTVSPEVPLA